MVSISDPLAPQAGDAELLAAILADETELRNTCILLKALVTDGEAGKVAESAVTAIRLLWNAR